MAATAEPVGDNSAAWQLDIDRFKPAAPKNNPQKKRMKPCLMCCNGKQKKINEYYEHQDEMYEAFSQMAKMDDPDIDKYVHTTTQEERDNVKKGERMAIRVSNIANVFILALKCFASVKSMSLAIIASTLDSLLDLLSGFILWFATFRMRRGNKYIYPIGKKRMQPLGILVFAAIMATLGLQIIIESGRQLVSSSHSVDLNGSKLIWVVAIMSGTAGIKLLLMIYCRSFDNPIVRTYGQDHMFDVITNVVGLGAALLANWFYWWIDPVGAIILALYTMRTWSMTAIENIRALSSRSASPDFLAKITYLVWNHHKAILKIDMVRAYTLGTYYFAEVDIMLPRDMPLHEAHDIGESLQNKLESLPEIERAFVHLDFEFDHKDEHAAFMDD